ncbi:MAG: sodium/proline symporter [Deltaproteobacteria bacterium]|jgi:sodium/proline symporter|nr:sodium/proline symporter [Deltaproteobacteria bacterium]MBW2537931.1 sodium/proline symporter [Deltaproteobacteria bacterium]
MNVYDELSHPLALGVFVITLFLPVLVGFVALRRTKTQSDFFVGGRAMGRIVVALSAVSSGRSSWLVLGLSGVAYKMGVGAIWAIVGYITVEAVQFVTLGHRLRQQTQTYQSITLLDYFASRFDDRRHLLRVTGAVIIAIFITAYVAAQLNAGAKSLTAAVGMPLELSLTAAAALILVYMVLGGYVAVALNDVVRALIMLIGLVVLPVAGLLELGGFGALWRALSALHPGHVDPLSIGWGALIGFVGIGLGSPGQPHIVVRYMSIDDPANLKVSAVVGTAWNVVLGLGAVCIGLLGRALVPDVASLPDADPEMVYLVLSSSTFGPALYGLLVGGIFAAILSTADSQLLVVASTLVRDVGEQILRLRALQDEASKLRLSRVVVVAAGLAALVLAYTAKDLVFWLVLFAWAGLGASLGPALILALYWRPVSRRGVFAGMVVGTVTTVVWKLWLKQPTGIYELIPAFVGSIIAIVLVSLALPDRERGEPGRS